MLRSIPPANRRPNKLSSTHAAIGAQVGSAQRVETYGSEWNRYFFQPKIIQPDPQRQGQKEIYYKAIQSLTKQLEELIASAEEPAEAAYWTQQLAKLKGVDI